ncbi:MAG: four helix bundle protein [Desulfobacteraceae bacterium]|nr:MAG: four helix bundle protein [Desulfobacteraceae bacterium]
MKSDFENLRVYQLAEKIADQVWEVVSSWDGFAKFTTGKQIVDAADSIGANIAEGAGRGSYADNRRFARIARGSLYEVRHWLRRAYKRNLLPPQDVTALKDLIDDLTPRLGAYINSIGKQARDPTTDTFD